MQKYFDILGISPTASETDIKKAFKEKAKLLHPDRNSSPTAHEEFLALYEALNFTLRNLQYKQTYNTVKSSPQKQREQAIRFAQMKYEAWTKTKEYKDLTNINTVQEFFTSLFILFVIVSIFGIIGKITEFKYGITTGLSIGLILSIIIIQKNAFGISLNLSALLKAISELISLKTGIVVIIFVLNMLIFFNIGLNTFLPLYILGYLYLISIVLFLLLTFFIFKVRKHLIHNIILSAGIVSFLLCLNFFISSNPTTTNYKLTDVQDDTLLELENDALKEFKGIRFFGEIENLQLVKSIDFTVKKGLLGIDVVSDTRFHRYFDSEK